MNRKIYEMAEVYKAFSEPTRLMIIKLLASNNVDKPCVLDLANKLNITSAAVSQHLKVLKSIGIVEPQRKGNQVFYIFNANTLRKYKEDIDEMFDRVFINCDLNCVD